MIGGLSFFAGITSGVIAGLLSVACLSFIKKCNIEEKVGEKNYKSSKSEGEYTMALIVRTDLNMSKGKIAAQCGHAAVGCVEKSQRKQPDIMLLYKVAGEQKIAYRINSVEDIKQLANTAREMGVVTSLVRDAGRTQIAPNSITVLGIGPVHNNVLECLTEHLKPL